MKKKMMLLLILLLPFMVNAKESCKVVNSNGKQYGYEVACGTEHFYVMEKKNNKMTMLAKYNLLVGDKIDYIEIEGTKPEYSPSGGTGTGYCYDYAEEKEHHPYFVYAMYEDPSAVNSRLNGCRVYEKLQPEHIRQDSKAVGTTLDGNGKSILPLYGITYMNPNWAYASTGGSYTNQYDDNGDLVLEGSSFKEFLDGYKAELESQSISVDDVSFVKLNRTLDFLKKIYGKDVEVSLEYPESGASLTNPEDQYVGKMDIKKYVDKENKWLYSTTYWLGSGFTSTNEFNYTQYNDYYISNEGMLCALGRGECMYLPYPIGNGIRPVVTVSTENMLFLIKTETDGNGTIEVVNVAAGNDTIQFRVTSKRGYQLDKLIVTTDAGEKIEFRRGEIINNSDGTVSISKNKFVMPFDNVTIQARWAPINDIVNPKTGYTILIVVLLLASLTTGTIIYRKKELRKS